MIKVTADYGPMYYVLEGIDNVGKTTQMRLLKELYSDTKVFTREPGGNVLSEHLRDAVFDNEYNVDRFTETMLFLASRSHNYNTIVKPALDSGKDVISDRGAISGLAYAVVNNTGFTIPELVNLNLKAIGGRKIDTVFLFNISKKTLEERRAKGSSDRIENRGVEYLLTAQEALLSYASMLANNVVTIDADEPIDVVLDIIRNSIES